MNRLVATLFVLLASATAAAAQPTSSPGATTLLHLTETAKRSVPRDRLRIVLAAEFIDRDAAKVQAEINRHMNMALARIKATPDIAVETQGYNVYEERSDRAPPRWHGSQSLSLTAKNFAALLTLAGALQQDGLVIKGLSPELSDAARRAVEDQLTEEALARLQARARRIAAGLGAKVASYRDLRIGNASVPPSPLRSMVAMASARAALPPVAAPGEATVSVTVSGEIVLTP